MDDLTIKPMANGPNLVSGAAFQILDVDGNAYDLPGDVVALCRCGTSGHKPFCDGTHTKIKFQSEPRVTDQWSRATAWRLQVRVVVRGPPVDL